MKNREDSPLLMRADILLYLTNVSERLAQTNQVYIITLFLCRLLLDVCYEDNRYRLVWWICSTVLEADILLEITDVSERLAQMIQSIS